MEATYFGRSKPILIFAVVALLALGAALRLVDLTDEPLDYQPARQLRAAIIARGIYHQLDPRIDPATRQLSLDLWESESTYEPSIFESIVALVYLATGEAHAWFARILGTIFWIVGGIFLFLLTRQMTTTDGAMVALAYYLVLPFAVLSSRSFQPEPLMVMFMIISIYAFYQWERIRSWRWAIFAGAISGLAVLIKVTALLPLAMMALAVVIAAFGLRGAVRNRQVWGIATLFVVIPSFYYVFSVRDSSAGFFQFWTLSQLSILTEPWFYVRWLEMLHNNLDLIVVFSAIFGILLLRGTAQALAFGLWIGYLLYGLLLPRQIYSHDYYNLLLVPIVALSIAPIAAISLKALREKSIRWQVAFLVVAVIALAYPAWVSRTTLLSRDYRGEAVGWKELSEDLPKDGPIIALTHEYGKRIKYYGFRQVAVWPYLAELSLVDKTFDTPSEDFRKFFSETTGDARYFVITHFGEYNNQPALKAWLEENFPSFSPRDSILIFDLSQAN